MWMPCAASPLATQQVAHFLIAPPDSWTIAAVSRMKANGLGFRATTNLSCAGTQTRMLQQKPKCCLWTVRKRPVWQSAA